MMEIYREFPLWQKLFGTGPDTFYFVYQPYFTELTKYWISSTNAAHNEYLNYLVTVGIFGLAAYLTVLISAIVHAVKVARTNMVASVMLAAVVGYASQAVVSIAQPITTPLFILFLSLCAGCSSAESAPGASKAPRLPLPKLGYRGRYEKP